jgi:hypothetical protein
VFFNEIPLLDGVLNERELQEIDAQIQLDSDKRSGPHCAKWNDTGETLRNRVWQRSLIKD